MTNEQFASLLEVLERIANALEKIANTNNSNDETRQSTYHLPSVIDGNFRETTMLVDVANIEPFRDFLRSRGILIEKYGTALGGKYLDGIATMLGNNYEPLQVFYKKLKQNLNTCKKFSMSLKDLPPDQISIINLFCRRLYEFGLLTHFKYEKSPICILECRPSNSPVTINFLSGGWLERYTWQVLDTLAVRLSPKITYRRLSNVAIRWGKDKPGEIDNLVYVNGDIYWIETKTGNYKEYKNRYRKLAKLLTLGKDKSFLVIADNKDTEFCREIERQTDMTVIGLSELKERLYEEIFDRYIIGRNNGCVIIRKEKAG